VGPLLGCSCGDRPFFANAVVSKQSHADNALRQAALVAGARAAVRTVPPLATGDEAQRALHGEFE